MALKTVLKLLLSKYGYLSIELQRAVTFDQGTVTPKTEDVLNIEEVDVNYVDNVHESAAEKAKQIIDGEDVDND